MGGRASREAFLEAHPECAAWTFVPLPYASRTKKGVLGVFQWSRRWCEEAGIGPWQGTPQVFAFERDQDAERFRHAVASAFAKT
jgi:hypothetical protein